MTFSRHPKHNEIVEALVRNVLPHKTLAKKFGTTVSTIKAMKARWVVETRERRWDPGEGQLHFFNRLRRKR